MRANYHQRGLWDVVQRYTRVWARRGGKWQIVLYQSTGVTSTLPPNRAGLEACGPETTAESFPRNGAASPETPEQMILTLEDEILKANALTLEARLAALASSTGDDD